jgi:hypothetical protein
VTKATLHDELLHEAGYEVPSLDTRERHRLRRRRWLTRVAVVFGLAAFGAIVAGLEFLRHGGRLSSGSIAGMVVAGLFAVGGLILQIQRGDEESSCR